MTEVSLIGLITIHSFSSTWLLAVKLYASTCAIVATEEEQNPIGITHPNLKRDGLQKKQHFNMNSGARRKLNSIPKWKLAFKRVSTV
jgi:hypothetical protein